MSLFQSSYEMRFIDEEPDELPLLRVLEVYLSCFEEDQVFLEERLESLQELRGCIICHFLVLECCTFLELSLESKDKVIYFTPFF